MNPSLIQLSTFVLQNNAEKEIYNIESEKYIIQQYIDDSKSSWAKGKYYLGGQIRMEPNDPITPELLNDTNKLFDASGDYYCNSFEYASILRAKSGLQSIETIVNKYNEIQRLRILQELEKTTLVSDVNKESN
jgi:hypothetical protein